MKIYKEKQDVDKNRINDIEITFLYKHFSLRHKERYCKPDKNPEIIPLQYQDFFNNWVLYLRGFPIFQNKNKMIRIIGNYMKNESIFKIIYLNIRGVFVPITIYEIKNTKVKWRIYQKILKIKKIKN